jgi:hypothetical protein
MIRLNVVLILSILVAANVTSAATLESLTAESHILRSVENQGFVQIEYCKNQNCVKYPSDQALQQMRLTGLTPSWEKIFSDCRQFQSLNQMYNYTNMLATLATFWNAGGIARHTQTVKYVVRKLGGVGRILGSRIVFDSAIFVAGSQITSLPAELSNESGLPYPDISEDDVVATIDFLEVLLNDSGHYFPPAQIIEAAATVIGTCSSQTYQRAYTAQTSECLQGCHNNSQPMPRLTATQHQPSFFSGETLAPVAEDFTDFEALRIYLNEKQR